MKTFLATLSILVVLSASVTASPFFFGKKDKHNDNTQQASIDSGYGVPSAPIYGAPSQPSNTYTPPSYVPQQQQQPAAEPAGKDFTFGLGGLIKKKIDFKKGIFDTIFSVKKNVLKGIKGIFGFGKGKKEDDTNTPTYGAPRPNYGSPQPQYNPGNNVPTPTNNDQSIYFPNGHTQTTFVVQTPSTVNIYDSYGAPIAAAISSPSLSNTGLSNSGSLPLAASSASNTGFSNTGFSNTGSFPGSASNTGFSNTGNYPGLGSSASNTGFSNSGSLPLAASSASNTGFSNTASFPGSASSASNSGFTNTASFPGSASSASNTGFTSSGPSHNAFLNSQPIQTINSNSISPESTSFINQQGSTLPVAASNAELSFPSTQQQAASDTYSLINAVAPVVQEEFDSGVVKNSVEPILISLDESIANDNNQSN